MTGQIILDVCQSACILLLAGFATRTWLRCRRLKATVIHFDGVLWTHRRHLNRLMGEGEDHE